MVKLPGFVYLLLSIVGAAYLQWYNPDWNPTQFWHVLAGMAGGLLWFFGAVIVNENLVN